MFAKKKDVSPWRWLGYFFVGMVVFTLLSRAVYQQGRAVVTTATPGSGTISHTVQLTGKTVANQEVAVTTVAGLRIGSVCVNEGQQVAEGEVLFRLDGEYLEEVIRKQEQELEKQRLTVADAANQNSQAQQQRANQQAQAEENYDTAVSQGQTTVERAQRELEQAEKALEQWESGDLEAEQQEKRLTDTWQQAQQAQQEAAAALTRLEQEQDAAIVDAIARAEAEKKGEMEEELPPELTPEERAAVEEEVKAGYVSLLEQARQQVQQTQSAAQEAEQALDAFRQNQNAGTETSRETLEEKLRQAQENYDDAVAALNSTKTTYGRAITSAKLPANTSHSAQIGQITYEQMALELEKLEALREANGEILAPAEGIVTRCNVQTGEKTTDTTAILLADTGKGCKFSGLASEEQSQYLGVGDLVSITTGKGNKTYRELPVSTFGTTQEAGGGYRVTVQIPANTLVPGVTAELSHTRKSRAYGCCVPLSALHLDAQNRTYVLVVEESATVMGTQLQARKVAVTVLEKNDTMAALEEGMLDEKDAVIVSADRNIESGSRVRVE